MKTNKVNKYKAEVWDIMQFIFSNFNDHQLHCIINFNSHIDDLCLQKAVNMSIKIFPLIKCRFIEDSCYPYWEECDFTANDIIKIFKTVDPKLEIKNLATFKTNEKIGPQLRINIARNNIQDSVCLIMNHMLCDGGGFKEYLYMLSSIYSHLKCNSAFSINYTLSSRSTKQIFKQFNTLEKLKILCSPSKLIKYNDNNVIKLEGCKSTPFIATHKITIDKFLYIKNYAKENNSTINDVILAAYLRVLHKLINYKSISVPCAINLRKYLNNNNDISICNLTSNLLCSINIESEENFQKTLFKVKSAMDAEKESQSCLKGLLLLEIIFKIYPYKIAKKFISKKYINPPIALTNIGLIDEKKLNFVNLEINDLYMNGSIKYNPYFQLAVTTFNNELTLSINFHGTQTDKEIVNNFLLDIDSELSKI